DIGDPNVLTSFGATHHTDVLRHLAAWGFPVVSHTHHTTLDSALSAYHHMSSIRSTLDFDADGVVYKVNRIDWQGRLGHIGRNSRWAYAVKFPADVAETAVEGIDVTVGRTGALTPVASLRPVTMGGVVVSRALLHNEDEIVRMGIAVGDVVVV